jgi:sugar phosphate permease
VAVHEAARQTVSVDRHVRRQWTVVGLMVVGYAGYYVCRSDYSVSLPLLIADLSAHGMARDAAKIGLGRIASLAVLGYALGKFVSGPLADRVGGRRLFLGGMLGSILCTIGFAAGGGIPIFTLAWIGNRLVQSTGWVGMVKLTSKWFSYAQYGTAMGVISVSYLLGDVGARLFMESLIEHGFGWRGLFLSAAAVLGVLFVINAIWLREAPEIAPADSPDRLDDGRGVLSSLFRSQQFWLACVLSLGFTLIRETFNTWTPTYFTEAASLSPAAAAGASAWFPLLGACSVVLSGLASDLLGRSGRARIMFVGLVASVGLLLLLAHTHLWPVGLVAATGFTVLGPYSYLAGATSLDFGGQRASATTCGIIDGVGYLGGVLAGDSMARVSVAFGWHGAFDVLAAVAFLTAIAALALVLSQESHGYRRADHHAVPSTR